VRSGEDVGVIYTLQTPKQLSGRELTERMQLIREQTRMTYCHPREDIEQQLLRNTGTAREQPVATIPLVADSEVVPVPAYATAQAYPPRYARWEEVDGDDD
jgi:hypothetical protein